MILITKEGRRTSSPLCLRLVLHVAMESDSCSLLTGWMSSFYSGCSPRSIKRELCFEHTKCLESTYYSFFSSLSGLLNKKEKKQEAFSLRTLSSQSLRVSPFLLCSKSRLQSPLKSPPCFIAPKAIYRES